MHQVVGCYRHWEDLKYKFKTLKSQKLTDLDDEFDQ